MARPTTRYIPSYTSLGNHPKLIKLARRLNISRPQAVGHLTYFWWWAMTYAEDGCLNGHDAEDIAVAAEWEGDPEAFADALLACGFINEDRSIHNWDKYGGKLVIANQNNAERQARYRDRQAQNEDITVTKRNRDGYPLSRVDKSRVEKPSVSVAPAKKKTRLPSDWWPNEDEISYAESKGLISWADEAEKFTFYWGGNGTPMLDWSLTWKRWVRTAIERRASRNGSVQNATQWRGVKKQDGTIQ